MAMKKQMRGAALAILLLSSSEAWAEGMVTMIDLGSKGCIPCKMMEPIMEKMAQDYEGRAVIRFIDIRENRAAAESYRIRAIPTQIFLDASGREVARHVGFMSEADMVAQLEAMGVAAAEAGAR